MTWYRASGTIGLCGACRAPIGAGDVYARTTRTKALRCERCARKVELPPAVTEHEVTP